MNTRLVLLNFSHPLLPEQINQAQELLGLTVGRAIERQVHFDPHRPFADQSRELVRSVGLTPEEWQAARLVVNLPSLDVIAALVLAEIHGRCGHFPAVVRMRRDQTGAAPVFQVTEIIDLQTLRDEARSERETA